jgi:hypothetical protein
MRNVNGHITEGGVMKIENLTLGKRYMYTDMARGTDIPVLVTAISERSNLVTVWDVTNHGFSVYAAELSEIESDYYAHSTHPAYKD